MINDLDPQQLARAFEALGDVAVLATGRWVAGGMIVDEQDGRSGIANRRPKHFSGMHQTGVQCANCYLMALYGL